MEMETSAPEATMTFQNKVVVLTGALVAGTRKVLSARLTKVGAVVSSSVSTRTDFLVAGDKPGSKLTKAQQLGIRIMLEQEFVPALLADEGVVSAMPPGSIPPPPRSRGTASVKNAAACNLLLSRKFNMDKDDPSGWLSEKLDGVRAYWDGSCLYTRLGNKLAAPPEFVAGFPSFPLDGELWIGRGKFQETVGAVRSSDPTRWMSSVQYHVFDSPPLAGEPGGGPPFESRYAKIVNHFGSNPPPAHLVVVPHSLCHSKDQMMAELARIEALGGEGVMLRERGSVYVHGRSRTLLKIKTSHDADALVIGHTKLASVSHTAVLAGGPNAVGSLRCRMANGNEFSVGSGLSDAVRVNPPPIGSIITYRFNGYTDAGIPRHPRFVGERLDLNAPSDWNPDH